MAKAKLEAKATEGNGGGIMSTMMEGQTQEILELRRLALSVIEAAGQLGQKFYDLTVYIRRGQIAPAIVRRHLEGMGFNKSRISEINRVANASEENWRDFEARAIGFRSCLDAERGKLVRPELLGLPAGDEGVEALRSALEPEEATVKESSSDAKTNEAIKLAKACSVLLTAAKAGNWRQRSFTIGNGWQVIVRREKVGDSISAGDGKKNVRRKKTPKPHQGEFGGLPDAE